MRTATKILLFCSILFLVLPVVAVGQGDSSQHVRTTIYPDRVSLAPGGRVRLAIILDHDENWHTYTNAPKLPPELEELGVVSIATSVTAVSDSPSLRVHTDHIQWPKPHSAQLDGSSYKVFAERSIIYVPLTVPADAAYGQARVDVNVTFQACNETQCLPPTTVLHVIQFSITTSDQSQAPAPEAAHIFSGFSGEVWSEINAFNSSTVSGETSGTGLNLIWIILGAGVVLILVAIIGAKLALGR